MISSIYNSTQLAQTEIRRSGAADCQAFKELLNESVQTSDISVPEKWITDGGLGNSAVEEVLRYLDIIGEDTKNRKPTHDITDEQIEWLKSRHDIERLRSGEAGYNASGGPAEIQNFYADLVYLNVFSPEDTKTAVTSNPIIPAYLVEEVSSGIYRFKADLCNPLIHGNLDLSECHKAENFNDSDGIYGCSGIVEMALRSLVMQTKLLNVIKDKTDDHERNDSQDEDAIAKMEELLKNKTECCEVLEKIFGQI